MVPPTSNSTGVPVLAVKAFPITRSTVSFQLPPHTLTTSEFWAWAVATGEAQREQRRDDEAGEHGESPIPSEMVGRGMGSASAWAAASMASTMKW